MASYTPNLNLLMKDPVADGADTFNIETMLNQNWEKIDRQVLLAMAAAAAYDAGTTYRKGDFCSQGGLLHRAGGKYRWQNADGESAPFFPPLQRAVSR